MRDLAVIMVELMLSEGKVLLEAAYKLGLPKSIDYKVLQIIGDVVIKRICEQSRDSLILPPKTYRILVQHDATV